MLKLNILPRDKQKMRQKIVSNFLKSCFLTFFYEYTLFYWEIFSGYKIKFLILNKNIANEYRNCF